MMEPILDAELEVALFFGEREMLLREILELSSGSVVELDRQIQEPVDLRVGGKTIARGELVVVDGNYGLRVTEIVTPQQRMDMLGTS
ncbi:MAG TPA: flagellar motor switch protein FliN [Terriglobia bacterium]|nr:flagellar motor switch protein FliN [Terriglobia bacterium]